jgi:hypothetical protein
MSNSRNNRIRMEDPFIRRPFDKQVFSHISDMEIAKYMVAVGYLEKDVLSYAEEIGIHPYIGSFNIFIEEMKLTFGGPKERYTDRLRREHMKHVIDFEFSVFGHKDPTYDLKQHFIIDHRKDPFNADFDKCYKRRERKQRLNFVNYEDFCELTREWRMNFDPIKTLQKL